MLSNARILDFAAPGKAANDDVQGRAEVGGGERADLAVYASRSACSRGRQVDEAPCPTRTAFTRDRDRILHATAFRRLNFKTQVFIFHEGDHYRSRLTHSLEVAQIARALARRLGLNEDLAEAIALAHDIGHTPFGHAGERALDGALKGFGGFDHNLQTLRVVNELEMRYASFDGLNLTWETLEGLIKHNGPLEGSASQEVPDDLRRFADEFGFDLTQQAGPEAQVAAIADDIAYNCHDIDDGLRAGLITIDDLEEAGLVWPLVEAIRGERPQLETRRLVFELNRRLISHLIDDVAAEAAHRLAATDPATPDDIRKLAQPILAFSAATAPAIDVLRRFLYRSVYRDERVMRIMGDAERIVTDLVGHYMNRPQDLPPEWRCTKVGINIGECAGRIRDFVAGMTDRYALELHRTLFDVTPKLR